MRGYKIGPENKMKKKVTYFQSHITGGVNYYVLTFNAYKTMDLLCNYMLFNYKLNVLSNLFNYKFPNEFETWLYLSLGLGL